MRKWIGIAMVGAGLLACSSSPNGDESGPPSLVGNWIFVNADATAGLGLTFKDDATYVASTLYLTSGKSGDAEVETGTYAVTGGTIEVTPRQYTCPGPDPVYTFEHSFNSSGNLVLTMSQGVISLKPNRAPASEDFAVRFGCYDSKTDTFTPSPLTDVPR